MGTVSTTATLPSEDSHVPGTTVKRFWRPRTKVLYRGLDARRDLLLALLPDLRALEGDSALLRLRVQVCPDASGSTFHNATPSQRCRKSRRAELDAWSLTRLDVMAQYGWPCGACSWGRTTIESDRNVAEVKSSDVLGQVARAREEFVELTDAATAPSVLDIRAAWGRTALLDVLGEGASALDAAAALLLQAAPGELRREVARASLELAPAVQQQRRPRPADQLVDLVADPRAMVLDLRRLDLANLPGLLGPLLQAHRLPGTTLAVGPLALLDLTVLTSSYVIAPTRYARLPTRPAEDVLEALAVLYRAGDTTIAAALEVAQAL